MPLGETSPDHSVGRVAEEFEIAILDDEDRPVGANRVGQICCRPKYPNVIFEGYWNRPEETAKAWRNLWMHTGDLGKIDEDGFVYFVDRAKDYLRCRGENISSFEVESTFLTHPAILEAALHAAGATISEDEIKITMVLKEGATITEHELCLWAIDNLPHFAVPRFYEFRSELIKNPTGRVLKYKLRDEGVTPATWDREAAGIQVRRAKPVRRSRKVA
jgi:crotonobetaine/carnitine-CoA ligase